MREDDMRGFTGVFHHFLKHLLHNYGRYYIPIPTLCQSLATILLFLLWFVTNAELTFEVNFLLAIAAHVLWGSFIAEEQIYKVVLIYLLLICTFFTLIQTGIILKAAFHHWRILQSCLCALLIKACSLYLQRNHQQVWFFPCLLLFFPQFL